MMTVVMTGGTFGFGRVTAQRLAAIPRTRVILGSRTVQATTGDILPLDLSRLSAVHAFAEAVQKRAGAGRIDALILNAGVAFDTNQHRTEDGHETTFAVNHLGHYLLLRLLLPLLADEARVIVTSSGTHDPTEGTIMPPPKHANARRLAHPDLDPEVDQDPKIGGGRAYAASKLCNVLTAQALRRTRHAALKKLTVVAYDPGPTPGTGLSRNRSIGVRLAWRILGSPLGRLVPKFSTQEAAGAALANLALGRPQPPPGELYARFRNRAIVWAAPSDLARDPGIAEALWRDSASLVGLDEIEH